MPKKRQTSKRKVIKPSFKKAQITVVPKGKGTIKRSAKTPQWAIYNSRTGKTVYARIYKGESKKQIQLMAETQEYQNTHLKSGQKKVNLRSLLARMRKPARKPKLTSEAREAKWQVNKRKLLQSKGKKKQVSPETAKKQTSQKEQELAKIKKQAKTRIKQHANILQRFRKGKEGAYENEFRFIKNNRNIAYRDLLTAAVHNKRFLQTLVNQADKFKHFLQYEIDIYGNVQGQEQKLATVWEFNKRLDEITEQWSLEAIEENEWLTYNKLETAARNLDWAKYERYFDQEAQISRIIVKVKFKRA